MYDQNWYNSGDIVPDQVTPASDATPLSDGTATAGINTEYSRGDHVHPLNITTTIPVSDSSSGSVGTTNYYARNDHSHPINITTTIPPQDSADGSVGTTNYYARNDHSHPINVETNASNIPAVNGVGANGSSAFYARQDHVHPQQLTYDGNVTATKFIKTGGLATEILCANGDTTTLDNKLSRTYNRSGGGWIRLCVFPAGASVGNPFIEFKVYTSYNAVQTIRLVPYYNVNGINTVYGVFTAPTRINASYTIDAGVNQLFHTHTGSGTSTIYSAYVRIESADTVTIVVSDQNTQYTNRITEILTQDVVTTLPSATQIPINYNFGYGGIMQDLLQVNPSSSRSKATYNNRIRIGNYTSESSIQLACSKPTISGTQTGQWEISKSSDNALTINPSSLRQADHSVGLSINSDSLIIKFNNNELVNVRTDQTITGVKTFDSFKKTNGTNQQILLADGSTTPLVLAQKEFYIVGDTQYIKLCTFNSYAYPYSTSVEFTFNCRSDFGSIQFNQAYTASGLGTYQYKLQTNFDYGMQVCYIVYYDTGADKYGELWARLDAWSNQLIIKQTKQNLQIDPLANVLNSNATSTFPTGYSSIFTLYPNIYKSPFQINPINGNGNEGLRIANTSSNYSLFCIGCDPNTVTGAIDNQWSIYKKTDGSLLIVRTSEQNTANRGLMISADGNTLTFNGRTL
ncbi:MAG: hypothetical protein EZS28_028830 [Streblomastix strix]|uniref:Uncharacterized protein n=1 Tax=Streblomastix strix TaxID=222440 RepID=A0A5J4UZJ8_9EUKA|nr:MAG: hypothetical protein EZS28_028830 [Streblomastix strix]